MAKKKFDPIKEVEHCCEILRTTPERWTRHRDRGCSDPTWADGVNMNLLRNHMIYAKSAIRSLCEEFGILMPNEMDIPIPPYVDANYFADPTSERAQRIMSCPSWWTHNQETPVDDHEMRAYTGERKG